MSNAVYSGALTPEALTYTVTPANGEDLSTVTAATLSVKYPDGTVHSWATTISAQSALTITLVHVFVAGDTDLVGNYELVALLTNSLGGPFRSIPKTLPVLDRFQT